MSEAIYIQLDTNDEVITAQLQKLQGQVNTLDNEIQQGKINFNALDTKRIETVQQVELAVQQKRNELKSLERDAQLSASKVVSIVRQSYGLMNQVLGMFGEAIGGVLGAVVSTAFTVVSTLISIATASSVSPYTIVQAALTFLAAALTLTAAIQAEQKKQQIQKEIQAAQQITSRRSNLARVTIKI